MLAWAQVPFAALPTSTDGKTRVGLSLLPPGSVPPQVLLLPVCPTPFLPHLAFWVTRLRLCTSVEMVLPTPGRAPVSVVSAAQFCLPCSLTCTDPQPVLVLGPSGPCGDQRHQCSRIPGGPYFPPGYSWRARSSEAPTRGRGFTNKSPHQED